eukprot:4420507-Heterocapsa_arctica.AAC.1
MVRLKGKIVRQKLGCAKNKEECEDGTRITTTNVSYPHVNFEYVLDMTEGHIVLIQEHWRLNEDIESWKTIVFTKGWHGVGNPAIKTQNTEDGKPGRSGGVAVLVLK